MKDKSIILYIGGWGRSGSTILGHILGQIERFFFVGELPEIWHLGVIENRYCACGKRFRECDLWKAVFDYAFGGIDNIDAELMIYYREHGTRNRHIPQMLFSATRTHLLKRLVPYTQNLKRLYTAIQYVTNCDVIVDSSKWPAYGRILTEVAPYDVYLIHLIRDARAVAYSWQRRQLLQPGTDNPLPRTPYGILPSTYQWIVVNSMTDLFWRNSQERYIQTKYEDFIDKPRENIENILSLFREKEDTLPFIDEKTIRLYTSHAMGGNPSKFRVGEVSLQLDDEWQYHMRRRDKILVTMLTFPLLKKYGYFT